MAKLSALSESAPVADLAGEGGPAGDPAKPDQATAELDKLRAKLPQLKTAAARVPDLEAAVAELQAVKVGSWFQPWSAVRRLSEGGHRVRGGICAFNVLICPFVGGA